MSNKLYLLMGAPGSGKSSWIDNHCNLFEAKHISRDEIRFSMVSENEEYFSKEHDVYNEFIREIDETLDNGFDVYADATHLNKASRYKTLKSINPKKIPEINVIWIKTPLEECIKRNENRIGTRSFVPKSVIRRMHHQIEKPEFEEGFNTIYIVENNKPIQIIKED